MMPTDEEVVGRVLGGERALFELIMRRHNQRLYRVVRSVLRNDAEAEDAVQQAYLSAFANLRQWNGQAKFSTWLTRIALNEAFTRAGRSARRGEVELEEGQKMDAPSPEEQAVSREITDLVEHAIDKLPEIYRTVIMMREVQELSTSETAECLDCTEEAVKVRLHRARGLLREALCNQIEESSKEAFVFLGARCDRIVAAVMARLSD